MTGSRRRLASLALLACLVTMAGCTYGVGESEPAAPSAEGSTPTIESVSLANSSLDLPADRILADLQAVLEADIDSPPVQVVELPVEAGGDEADDAEEDADEDGGSVTFQQTPYRFAEHVALDELGSNGTTRVDGGIASGATTAFGTVRLVVANASRAEQEKLLVHEYTHAIQFDAELIQWSPLEFFSDIPTDEAQVKWALAEGGAVWVTDQYIEAHMPDNVTLQSTEMAEVYEDSRVGTRFQLARYHLGAIGIDRHVDDPAELRDFYSGPLPNSTEQLIHGYTPAEEPITRLPVEATDGDGWTVQDPGDEDRLGELVVRVALSKELSLDEAATAAAGWGSDHLVEFERNDTAGFAWVTRWDDPANASEFESALATYVERRDTGEDLAFGVDRPGDETVVLYSGPPAFVDAAWAEVDGDVGDGSPGVRVGVAENG